MLVLGLREGDEVVVQVPGYPDMVVTYTEHRGGDRIRLGFAADPAIKINRRKRLERQEAASGVVEPDGDCLTRGDS